MLITLTGWVVLLLGLARMFAPDSARPPEEHLFASFVFLVVLLGTGIVLTVKAFGSDSRSGRAFGPARPSGNARAHRRQRRSHGQRFAPSTMIQFDRRHCHLA